MKLHECADFAGHAQAAGRNVDLHMVKPKFHLADGKMLASTVGFAGHFLKLGKSVVGVHMETV